MSEMIWTAFDLVMKGVMLVLGSVCASALYGIALVFWQDR